MALTQLNEKIDAIRAEASKVGKRYTEGREAIRADRNLSAHGQEEMLNDLREHTRKQLSELEQQEKAAIEAKRRSAEEALNRTTGSLSYDIISFRDAQDRAERLEDQADAEAVMRRAIASKDTVLATAVMRRAMTAGWDSAAEVYAAEYPATAEHVQDLAQIARYENSMQAMVDRFIYEVGR